jgi:lantibiotic biosynthesis protein
MNIVAPQSQVMAAAEAIGRALCKAAVWDDAGERCNWLGRSDIENPGGGLATGMVAVYTYLAGGSAGIALFLAELAARTGAAETRRTAHGALRRTLDYARNKTAKGQPFSFLTGYLGIAYVVLRFRALGLADDVSEDVAWCMRRLDDAFAAAHPLDFMGGTAGVVAGLVQMRRELGGDAVAMAARYGEEICTSAERADGKACWNATRAVGRDMNCPPLTGLSHGAAGMALALLELYAVSGRDDFLKLAREAIAYEDAFYSASAGNWLDVRFPFDIAGAEPLGRFQIAWCHGAPGIALTRLRAAQIDPERAEDYRTKATRALEITLAGATERLALPRWDASLCHGLGGLSEILLIASGLTDDGRWLNESEVIMAELCRRYGRTGDWPGGTSTGDLNPSFMLGTPGIGHHLLRLLDSDATPPVLMGRPWTHATRQDEQSTRRNRVKLNTR